MACRRTAVLISGGGTNLQALLDAGAAGRGGAEIGLVIGHRPDAFGLERARRAGVAAHLIDHRRFASRDAFDAALDEALTAAGIELICLAGFMRLLTTPFVERWRDRLLNVHPSLLPAFRGLRTHDRALAAGVRVHGCTVHLVRPELDEGPILVQGVAPVLPEDSAPTLAARVLELEHVCYPRALALLASGRARVEGETVVVGPDEPLERLVLHPLLGEGRVPA